MTHPQLIGKYEILEELGKKNTAYLAQVIPQLGLNIKTPQDEDEKALREGIFNTLIQFIPKILDNRPIILFIDDLHLGDEATLLLLRRLILNPEIPIFVCSTSMETKGSGPDQQMVPLDRFCATYDQELGIRKISLSALTDMDISNHIQRLFPNVSLPHNFEKDLAEISHGNPLFTRFSSMDGGARQKGGVCFCQRTRSV